MAIEDEELFAPLDIGEEEEAQGDEGEEERQETEGQEGDEGEGKEAAAAKTDEGKQGDNEAAGEDAKAVKMVPLSALEKLRAEVKELKREKQALPPLNSIPPSDPRFAQLAQAHAITGKLEASRTSAEREFGAELVEEAFNYFNDKPRSISEAFLKDPEPFRAAVLYYQAEKAKTQATPAQAAALTPDAIAQQVTAQVLAALGGVLPSAAAKTTAAPPPSLANRASISGAVAKDWDGPAPLSELFPE